MREGYKNTVLGEISVDWEVVKLGEVINNFDAKRVPLKSEDRAKVKGIYPYYGAQGIIDYIDDFIFEGEYLLIAEDGENVKSRKNDIAFIAKDRFWLNNHAHILQSNKRSDIIYLKNIINFISIKEYVTGQAQPKLNKSALEKIKIKLPPLPEQKKIAEILSTVDEKIDAIEQQIVETSELKKGLMQKLLTKGIGHTKFKDSPLGEIPESWEVVKLEELCDKITDGSHSSPVPDKKSNYKIATVKDMTERKFNLETCENISFEDFSKLENNGCKPIKGDVLFSKDGTIGKTFVYNETQDIVLLSSIAIIRLFHDVSPYYICQILKSNVFYFQLKGLKSGSAIKRLILGAIKKIKIPICPLPEQKQIATILSTVDEKLDTLRDKKAEYQQMKKGLMQQLLTGKVRVKVLQEC